MVQLELADLQAQRVPLAKTELQAKMAPLVRRVRRVILVLRERMDLKVNLAQLDLAEQLGQPVKMARLDRKEKQEKEV
jgi:hypothetical protein